VKKVKNTDPNIIPGFDYSTSEARVDTAQGLFQKAKTAKSAVEQEWIRYNDYYNFCHDAYSELKDYCEGAGIPFRPAVCPDPWIAVESQIDPNVPEPGFRGRDDDRDSAKAKQREYAVKYILENNDIVHLNTRNERRLLKLGDAFWKAYHDNSMRCGMQEGDIRIADVPPEMIFPDPSVKDGDLQHGQYVDNVYFLHKVDFWQTYRKRLQKLGIEANEIAASAYVQNTSIFQMVTAVDDKADTVQILEHWFKWPDDATVEDADGKKIKVNAGDVACSIQAGQIELKLIPCYWRKTRMQCKLFPYVHYWRIRDENQFWNKSELFSIMELVDAEDRKLSMALLNDMFMSNDIILMEEDALADGTELDNSPGAINKVKKNRINSVARLGGLHTAGNATILLNYLKEQIERANRNYETNLGKETSRQTTASGLAMLREDSDEQNDIKKADRRAGFERLYELLDWLALEYFDDDRMIFLGADKEKRREEAIAFSFNRDAFGIEMPTVYDSMTGEPVREAWTYFPKVDVTVTAGDSVVRSKQATLNALGALASANITADNWQLYAAQLDILDIPDKAKIIEGWKQKFAQPQETQMGGISLEMPGL